jgi:hypothetical protein
MVILFRNLKYISSGVKNLCSLVHGHHITEQNSPEYGNTKLFRIVRSSNQDSLRHTWDSCVDSHRYKNLNSQKLGHMARDRNLHSHRHELCYAAADNSLDNPSWKNLT